ncbi:cell division protein FtsL [Thioalkalivibrio sp. HK1]|uniref:cell division protein FtsL n=1 Tax=Thioalkalivibrio sp. HK1 TaxID=1469245 RepID=UPI00047087A5|nr:cell division protein FtsL [Thioalkalivibrio sp. HK1]
MVRASVLGIALLAVVASAVAVVHTHHQRRTLVVALERMEERRDHLRIEWAMLHLEHSTWAAGERIEKIAADSLGLYRPPTGVVRQVTIERREIAPEALPAIDIPKAGHLRTGYDSGATAMPKESVR